MKKKVGEFIGAVSPPHPCQIEIMDAKQNTIRFTHRDIADLKHLISELEKAAKDRLPDNYKHEV